MVAFMEIKARTQAFAGRRARTFWRNRAATGKSRVIGEDAIGDHGIVVVRALRRLSVGDRGSDGSASVFGQEITGQGDVVGHEAVAGVGVDSGFDRGASGAKEFGETR